MHSNRVKGLLRWIGSALSLFGVIFIVVRLRDYGSEIDYSQFASLFLPLVVLSVIYGVSNSLLVLSWKDLLKHLGVPITFPFAFRLYGESQLAKYVPGNVFHFVGRQVLGQEAGLPAWSMAKSAIWEIGVLIIAGSLFSVLVLPSFNAGIPVFYLLLFFVTLALIAVRISGHLLSRWVARALGTDLAFLAVSAGIFLATLFLVIPAGSINFSQAVVVCGAYVVAWLVGLLTPGAPAGAGIRELVLYTLLKSIVNEADLLTAIVLGRIITVCGDVMFYLLALLSRFRTPSVN